MVTVPFKIEPLLKGIDNVWSLNVVTSILSLGQLFDGGDESVIGGVWVNVNGELFKLPVTTLVYTTADELFWYVVVRVLLKSKFKSTDTPDGSDGVIVTW